LPSALCSLLFALSSWQVSSSQQPVTL